jgi:hypothetical protein
VKAEAEVTRLETAVAEVLTHSILLERLAMTTTEVELARLEMAITEVLRATSESLRPERPWRESLQQYGLGRGASFVMEPAHIESLNKA